MTPTEFERILLKAVVEANNRPAVRTQVRVEAKGPGSKQNLKGVVERAFHQLEA